jgi:hypothetical protein
MKLTYLFLVTLSQHFQVTSESTQTKLRTHKL